MIEALRVRLRGLPGRRRRDRRSAASAVVTRPACSSRSLASSSCALHATKRRATGPHRSTRFGAPPVDVSTRCSSATARPCSGPLDVTALARHSDSIRPGNVADPRDRRARHATERGPNGERYVSRSSSSRRETSSSTPTGFGSSPSSARRLIGRLPATIEQSSTRRRLLHRHCRDSRRPGLHPELLRVATWIETDRPDDPCGRGRPCRRADRRLPPTPPRQVEPCPQDTVPSCPTPHPATHRRSRSVERTLRSAERTLRDCRSCPATPPDAARSRHQQRLPHRRPGRDGRVGVGGLLEREGLADHRPVAALRRLGQGPLDDGPAGPRGRGGGGRSAPSRRCAAARPRRGRATRTRRPPCRRRRSGRRRPRSRTPPGRARCRRRRARRRRSRRGRSTTGTRSPRPPRRPASARVDVFTEPRAAATTCTPRRVSSWTSSTPAPPAAARTSTRSPGDASHGVEQRLQRRTVVEQGHGLLVGEAVGDRDQLRLRHHGLLGVAADRDLRPVHDLLGVGDDAAPGAGPRHPAARHVGRADREEALAPPRAQQRVQEHHVGCGHGDHRLAGSRLRIRDVDGPQHLGSTELLHQHRTHGHSLRRTTHPRLRPGGRSRSRHARARRADAVGPLV